MQCASWIKINCGTLHRYCTLYATQVQSISLSLHLSLSPPHSPSLTATLQIHYLRDLQTNLALSHSPHTHTLSRHPHNQHTHTHTLSLPTSSLLPSMCHWLLLSYRPPPSFFAANKGFAFTTGFDRYPHSVEALLFFYSFISFQSSALPRSPPVHWLAFLICHALIWGFLLPVSLTIFLFLSLRPFEE